MKLRLPLYGKILFWFFLNLVFLAAAFYSFFRIQFRLGLDWLLLGPAGDRIEAVTKVIADEIATTQRSEWNATLKRMSDAYKVQFFLFHIDGVQAAGESITLPPSVRARVSERRGPLPREGGRPGFGFGPMPRSGLPEVFRRGRGFEPPGEFRPGRLLPRLDPAPPGPHPKSMMHTPDPSRYWVLVRLPVNDPERPRPMGGTLVLMSDSIQGGGLFFDFRPWIAIGLGAVLVSALFWFPLVRGITRSISQMTHATEQISQGSFEARVDSRRTDELGVLSQAINRMAARLSGFVTGQKRFLGDIAHELCSPIARIQLALGVLEQRADDKQKAYVDDLREEVQQMSQLVNELLSFSKAGLKKKEIVLKPVDVAQVIRKVVSREAQPPAQTEVRIEEPLPVLAEPELLARALANVVRNAVRYAGDAGPISISANSDREHVNLTVADHGPGVPEEMLGQIFDPFFRLEASRSRETGGMGLGLAIVKTCVEACQGSVTARNRQPSGLQLEITLKK
ncbi:MAG: HAMP domain-containing histidine kinase [Verrucomicrobia bacterium]|nr:HAMP domain-containing histidine kinase [Verrucomicrobiota bacterium]